jgi:hypothetical protein
MVTIEIDGIRVEGETLRKAQCNLKKEQKLRLPWHACL